ncbi:hypothetical protein AcV5_003924 [Taiwanofungus camphoratus]|nr:hypothetical protein AcV5_003924 [Antrodia cinnamomea]
MSRPTCMSDIKSAMFAIDSKLADLRVREQEARNILAFILEHKSALEQERAALEAQRNPFNSLPTELLIQVFQAVLEVRDVVDEDDIHSLAFYRRPVTLSHVCRRWRAVALSASNLWSHVLFSNIHAVEVFLGRSKEVPIDVVGAPSPSVVQPIVGALIKSFLIASTSRWRSVEWTTSAPAMMRHIVAILNDAPLYPLLQSLELKKEGSALNITQVLERPAPRASPFPVLRNLRLTKVAPCELPPGLMPALRALELCFPVKDPLGSTHIFRLSDFCALVSRAPNLEELTLDDAVPLMDIYVDVHPETAPNWGVPHHTRRTPIQITPVVLQRLRQFEWSFAPPKDLWTWFFFMKMPSLQRLDLCLDRASARWLQFYNNALVSGTSSPLIGLSMDPIVVFPKLEELRIECLDGDGITSALKKMKFSALEKLSIEYLPPTVEKITTPLPRHESIFREPRMPTLTHLTLSHFELDTENATTMLKYFPSLSHLTLEACVGAGKVVCALSGGTCGNFHTNTLRSWICPRLDHLALVNCIDLKFSCLSEVVRVRKKSSLNEEEDKAGGSSSNVRSDRILKPLKRRAPQPLCNGSLPSNTPFGKSRLGLSSPLLLPASPNGSFVPGWNSHQAIKPTGIISLYIEGCPRVSKIEVISLMEPEWGITDVTWFP